MLKSQWLIQASDCYKTPNYKIVLYNMCDNGWFKNKKQPHFLFLSAPFKWQSRPWNQVLNDRKWTGSAYKTAWKSSIQMLFLSSRKLSFCIQMTGIPDVQCFHPKIKLRTVSRRRTTAADVNCICGLCFSENVLSCLHFSDLHFQFWS